MSTPSLFGDDDPLALAPDEVARLTAPERERRVLSLIDQSVGIFHSAVSEHVHADGLDVAAVAVLFSGGNDSTVLAYLFRGYADVLVHANTGIGIEATRRFVRDVALDWNKRLIEVSSPREVDSYRAMVLEGGFPGPSMHWKAYTRLKERVLERVRNALVENPRQQRVVYLAGRRRTESDRRAKVVESERKGSIVFVSPLVNWTKLDMNTYRLMSGDVPVNPVSDILHMSGECLCGAFAHPGELDEIEAWFPDVVREIRALEDAIADRPDIPEVAKKWGWGATASAEEKASARSGYLCSSCDARFQQLEMVP